MSFDCLEIDTITGFDWDEGNIYKNKVKHNLNWWEIEEIFFNSPIIKEDKKHSETECRCFSLGETDDNLELFVVFTIRNDKIRIISARQMSKKERRFYAKFKNNT